MWIASPARSRRVRDVFGARRARNNRELESHCAKCAIIIFLIAARTCTCARPLVVLHFYYNTLLQHRERELPIVYVRARLRKISHTRSMRSFCMEISIFRIQPRGEVWYYYRDFHYANIISRRQCPFSLGKREMLGAPILRGKESRIRNEMLSAFCGSCHGRFQWWDTPHEREKTQRRRKFKW